MAKSINIKKIISPFSKKIKINGDKSLSIRWALTASQANGKSRAFNLLMSEDILSTLHCLKKLGVKIKMKKSYCEINGLGLNSFKYKKNLILNAGNSGTLARLILGLLITSPFKIKLIGDKSLSKRDFSRVIVPLKKFGAKFFPKNKSTLPIFIKGSNTLSPINYLEKKGSAQCKSSVMYAALNTPGKTFIKAKKSRDHTEILFKNLNIPIKIKKGKKYDFIKLEGKKNIRPFNYNIPSDISSSAFFIVLTLLAKKSSLIIKNVNVNPSRIGVVTILNKMGAKIKLKNKKTYKGEKIADIYVKSMESFKAINCPVRLNSSAIDEFLIIFLIAARSNGVSSFKGLSELNQKESPRLKLGSKILNMMGVKTIITNDSLKIYGKSNLKLNKTYQIKNYSKDHRIAMMTTIAALTLGGNWRIHDYHDSIKSSFPSFLETIRKLDNRL